MQVQIEKIVYPGKSLAFCQGKTIFTDEGLPGEIVEITLIKEKKKYSEAKTIRILQTSPFRVQSRCSHYLACSPYQSIDYAYQLEIKRAQIREIFERTLKREWPEPVLNPSPQIWGYRNKVRFHIARKETLAYLAYHQLGAQDEFVKVEECFLVSEQVNALSTAVLRMIHENQWDVIQEIEIKESSTTKEMLLVLFVNSSRDLNNLTPKLDALAAGFPLKGIVGLFKTKKAFREILLWGEDFVQEKVADCIFSIGSQSFFQVNVGLLEKVVADIKKSIPQSGEEKIMDLYCGIGTFGLALASKAREVIGVESEPENIAFLKKNLLLNKVGNFTVCEGTSEKWIPWVLKKAVDVLFLDPPRKGIDLSLIQNLHRNPVPCVIYLSCNPSTLIRDLKLLLSTYKLKDVRIYDFFPHSPHIETCVFLEKI
jgi:23S rRNA (uracil1939-C5)-methyltransferase